MVGDGGGDISKCLSSSILSIELAESIDPLRLRPLGLWKEVHRSTTKEKERAVGDELVVGGCDGIKQELDREGEAVSDEDIQGMNAFTRINSTTLFAILVNIVGW